MKSTEQCVKLYPIPMRVEEMLDHMRVHLYNLEADHRRHINQDNDEEVKLALSRWACMSSSIRNFEKLIKISG